MSSTACPACRHDMKRSTVRAGHVRCGKCKKVWTVELKPNADALRARVAELEAAIRDAVRADLTWPETSADECERTMMRLADLVPAGLWTCRCKPTPILQENEDGYCTLCDTHRPCTDVPNEYRVSGVVTVSCYTDVLARGEHEAAELANRGMQGLCHQCAGGDSETEWSLSGELDGEPEVHDAEILRDATPEEVDKERRRRTAEKRSVS